MFVLPLKMFYNSFELSWILGEKEETPPMANLALSHNYYLYAM